MRTLILSALLLAACQTATRAPSPPALHLVDLTGAFSDFYDATQDQAPNARRAAFKSHFSTIFPGFYVAARLSAFGVDDARYDRMITDSLQQFPAIRGKYAEIAAGFGQMIEPARLSFSRAFPDIGPVGDIYLLHSLGEMDGGTRTINGQTHLIFGADVMARIHAFADEQPFFQHEFFHVYHQRFFKDCDGMWCGLWTEGLATYVAATLNPTASDDELLLTSPQPLRPFVDTHLQQAVCTVRAHLSDENGSLFFSGGRALEGYPPRFGYYVGFLVAREAGKTRSLQQLAHMTPAEARPVVDAALASLASCPN